MNIKEEIKNQTDKELLHGQFMCKKYKGKTDLYSEAKKVITDILSSRNLMRIMAIWLNKKINKYNHKGHYTTTSRITHEDKVRIIDGELHHCTDELHPTHEILECWGGIFNSFHIITKNLENREIEIFKI
jgi:hypothetical protein